jgi:hypothetical protein
MPSATHPAISLWFVALVRVGQKRRFYGLPRCQQATFHKKIEERMEGHPIYAKRALPGSSCCLSPTPPISQGIFVPLGKPPPGKEYDS